MLREKYAEKARNILATSRATSTRADIANLLSLESINLALAETLAIAGIDENDYNHTYEQSLPDARQKLVHEFLSLTANIGIQQSRVDYRKVISALKENEASGGRGAFEPRTVLGESKLIASVLGIISSNGDLDSGRVEKYVEANMEQIFQNLMFALEEF